MNEWSTTSVRETDADPQAVWHLAYADADAYPHWNPEIAEAKLEGPLAQGARIRMRFRTGLRLSFRVVEFNEGRIFTDEARLPFARMGHRHIIERRGDGRATLTNTIYVRGPLAPLWAALIGRRAAAALPTGQEAIEQLARGSS